MTATKTWKRPVPTLPLAQLISPIIIPAGPKIIGGKSNAPNANKYPKGTNIDLLDMPMPHFGHVLAESETCSLHSRQETSAIKR